MIIANNVTPEQYELFVRSRCKSGETIARDILPAEAHLLHMAVGVAGEAGELLDAVKKHVIYKKRLDIRNVEEELGDLEFYMQGLRDALRITRQETINRNVKKLTKRYGSGAYTDSQAQARADKVEGE